MRIIGNRGNTARKVQAVASGVLASGDTVVVNADGTVSVVSQSGPSAGTPTVYETGEVGQAESKPSAAYDTTSNRIVVAYKDDSNSDYGTVLVGTVSSGSISFGTAVVFASAYSAFMGVAYDSNANKTVIVYSDAQSDGNAIVGTVDPSDNSISFGSPAEYNGTGVSTQAITFDSTANKVVIVYKGDSQHGHIIVGTVNSSNNSISFGADNEWQTAQTNNVDVNYDSNANKSVITYVDAANSDKGAARVATVSGTSISLGSEVIFRDSTTSVPVSIFDSTNNKIVVAYRNQSGSPRSGIAQVGTVSGTSISFGSEVEFEDGVTNDVAIGFDSINGKVVISYTDDGDSGKGKAVVGTVSGTNISFTDPIEFESGDVKHQAIGFDPDTSQSIIFYCDADDSEKGKYVTFNSVTKNLTAENYIGIASNGYATGQAATINAKGFIDDNQSSLTAGQSYYVQTNGDLGLTAADPSVFAGTAVSATKLIVKG